MLAEEVDYVVGVDTHRDQHVLAVVVASTGGVIAQRSVRSNARGYVEAMRFAGDHAPGARIWAVEGAGHYRRRRRDGARGQSYCSWRGARCGARTTCSMRYAWRARRSRAQHARYRGRASGKRLCAQRDHDRAGELARRAATAAAGRAAPALQPLPPLELGARRTSRRAHILWTSLTDCSRAEASASRARDRAPARRR
jgi:hypothetical protein